MTVTYEVGGSSSSGRLDIDFYVSQAPSRCDYRRRDMGVVVDVAVFVRVG
jgi:hypothetical protein